MKYAWSWVGNGGLQSLPSRERGLKSIIYSSHRKIITSLPSRERGLKFLWRCPAGWRWNVAPFAGAWIEISVTIAASFALGVAPFAGAWIEINSESQRLKAQRVAPFAGAWIEIPTVADCIQTLEVAPFAGAWIEMQKGACWITGRRSLPSRERGLKSETTRQEDRAE